MKSHRHYNSMRPDSAQRNYQLRSRWEFLCHVQVLEGRMRNWNRKGEQSYEMDEV